MFQRKQSGLAQVKYVNLYRINMEICISVLKKRAIEYIMAVFIG